MGKLKFAVLCLLATTDAVGKRAVDAPREGTGRIYLTDGQAEPGGTRA